jgi:hypothetical protein
MRFLGRFEADKNDISGGRFTALIADGVPSYGSSAPAVPVHNNGSPVSHRGDAPGRCENPQAGRLRYSAPLMGLRRGGLALILLACIR